MTDFPKIPAELLPVDNKVTVSALEMGQKAILPLLISALEVDADAVLWIKKDAEADKRPGNPVKDLTVRITRMPEGLSIAVEKGTTFKNLISVERENRDKFLPVVRYEIL